MDYDVDLSELKHRELLYRSIADVIDVRTRRMLYREFIDKYYREANKVLLEVE
jgi:hypothetical protein